MRIRRCLRPISHVMLALLLPEENIGQAIISALTAVLQGQLATYKEMAAAAEAGRARLEQEVLATAQLATSLEARLRSALAAKDAAEALIAAAEMRAYEVRESLPFGLFHRAAPLTGAVLDVADLQISQEELKCACFILVAELHPRCSRCMCSVSRAWHKYHML